VHAPSYFPPVSFPMGAYHTVELQFLFPLYHGATGSIHGLSAPEQALSRKMIGYWTRFARDGSPSPQWPRLNTRNYMALGVQGASQESAASFAAAHKCDFWEKTLL
jgi:para-nitrobenzyl esterase